MNKFFSLFLFATFISSSAFAYRINASLKYVGLESEANDIVYEVRQILEQGRFGCKTLDVNAEVLKPEGRIQSGIYAINVNGDCDLIQSLKLKERYKGGLFNSDGFIDLLYVDSLGNQGKDTYQYR